MAKERSIQVPAALLRAMLDQGKDRPGRLWLLLQVFDPAGHARGYVELDQAGRLGAAPGDLEAGLGLFWTIDPAGRRIYLRSAGKVAAALGVSLRGDRVAVPVGALQFGPPAIRQVLEKVPA